MVRQATITEQAGDSFNRDLRLTDNGGNPIDITGWTFVLTLKEERSDSDANAILQDTVTTHANPTQGETSVSFTASQTENLLGDYWYDLKFKTDGGEVDSILAGVFRIEDSITDTL